MSSSIATNGNSDANSGTSASGGVGVTLGNPVFIGTDNRCCFCLTLRTGSVIVGVVNALVSTLLFSWYATSPSIQSSWSHATPFSDLDMSIVIVFVLQIVVDGILIAAAVKKQAAHTVPWLCTNSIVMGILLVLVTLLLFFGFSALHLSYDEYVSILSLIGCLAGGHLFSCLVVFQFRKNLIEDAQIRLAIQQVENGDLSGSGAPSAPPRAPSPPPTYEEVSKTSPPQLLAAAAADLKQSEGSLPPPEYDAAVAFMKGEEGGGERGEGGDDNEATG